MTIEIQKNEWDFSDVPDDEIRDCCIYEYAREGDAARWILFQELRKRSELPGTSNELKAETEQVFRRFFGIFQYDENEPWSIDKVPRAAPWKNISGEQKVMSGMAIRMLYKQETIFPPVSWVRIEHIELLKGVVSNISQQFITPVKAPDEVGVFCAWRIDLERATDEEIIENFRAKLTWMRESFNYPLQNKRGNRLALWRSHLDNLVWMRLRHALDRSDILATGERLGLKFWDSDGNANDSIANVDLRILRARACFRELFPELGKNAEPERFRTFLHNSK